MDTDLLKSIGSKLMNVAPALAGAILSPNPSTAMAALASIKSALGLAPAAQEAEINQAITGTPEERLKFVVAENDFKAAMRKLDNDELFTRLADVQNARGMNVETTKATGKRDVNLYLMGWAIIGGFLATVACLLVFMWHGIPVKDDSGILFMLIGQLSTFSGMVAGYWFGTTQQSQAKTDMIHNSTPLIKGEKL